MHQYAIKASGIKRSFGEVKALKECSFSIEQGELFGFIGPDGSGKTTLFRILTTLLLADEGNAEIEGWDLVKDYKKIRKILGYMPGRFSLYMDLTVQENLEFYATIFGTTIKDNYHLIENIFSHIEPFRKRKAHALSGGMKQKLALSCALIHKPRILILDEPTTGVDAVSRKEFWEMLKDLQKMGISIVVSTPYMDEAELCDRVALIEQGNIMTISSPENIINAFNKKLYAIESKNIYKLIKDLREYPGTYSVFPFGQCVHYIGKENDDITKVEYHLQQNDNQGIVVKKIKAGIEDCFMDMMVQNKEK